MRGCPVLAGIDPYCADQRQGCPVLAGIDPYLDTAAGSLDRSRLPRTRGDRPDPEAGCPVLAGDPRRRRLPRTRGDRPGAAACRAAETLAAPYSRG